MPRCGPQIDGQCVLQVWDHTRMSDRTIPMHRVVEAARVIQQEQVEDRWKEPCISELAAARRPARKDHEFGHRDHEGRRSGSSPDLNGAKPRSEVRDHLPG
jgi:hypothetical protein